MLLPLFDVDSVAMAVLGEPSSSYQLHSMALFAQHPLVYLPDERRPSSDPDESLLHRLHHATDSMDPRHQYNRVPTVRRAPNHCLQSKFNIELHQKNKVLYCCLIFPIFFLPVPSGTMAHGGLEHSESWPTLSKHCSTQPMVPSPPHTRIL